MPIFVLSSQSPHLEPGLPNLFCDVDFGRRVLSRAGTHERTQVGVDSVGRFGNTGQTHRQAIGSSSAMDIGRGKLGRV